MSVHSQGSAHRRDERGAGIASRRGRPSNYAPRTSRLGLAWRNTTVEGDRTCALWFSRPRMSCSSCATSRRARFARTRCASKSRLAASAAQICMLLMANFRIRSCPSSRGTRSLGALRRRAVQSRGFRSGRGSVCPGLAGPATAATIAGWAGKTSAIRPGSQATRSTAAMPTNASLPPSTVSHCPRNRERRIWHRCSAPALS